MSFFPPVGYRFDGNILIISYSLLHPPAINDNRDMWSFGLPTREIM